MRIVLLFLFILSHLSLAGQIPYKADSITTLWPTKKIKSFTKTFYSPFEKKTYTYQLLFFENGQLKSKELVLSHPDSDSLIIAKSEWNEEKKLLKK